MAIDPNIVLQAGKFETPDYAQTMELRTQLQLRQAALAKANRAEAEAQARTVRLGSIGTKAAAGDYAGAKSDALAHGDFDVLQHINSLEGDQRATLQRRVEVAAPLAFEAQKLPYEQRKAFIAAQTPRLVANGWSPEELANFDPSDQALGSIVASAQTVGDMLKRQDTRAEFEDKRADRAADREAARGNAFIAAGLMPTGGAAATAGVPATAGGATAGRTQFGWTPRARNGGDNSDAAVDGKIAGMAKALGVDPDAPLTNMTPLQIAGALTLSEGGAGSIADKNNNPGNLRDPKTGDYRRFPTKAAGLQAAAAQVSRNLARGQTTIRTMVEGLPVNAPAGAPAASGLPAGYAVIPGGKLDKGDDAPLNSDALDAAAITYVTTGQMPTGLGRQGVTQREILNRAASIRKAGGTTPEQMIANWQDYKTHQQGLKAFATGPEARTTRSLNVTIDHLDTLQNAAQALQNGNIPIFNKVRQSYAKATGSAVPTNFEGVRQIVSSEVAKAITGGNTALADRQDLVHSIGTANSPQQLAGYIAEVKKLMGGQLDGLQQQYRAATGRDDFASRLSPRTRRALGYDQPERQGGTLSANIPTFTPEQARNAPKGTRFRTTDGRVMVRQ